MKYPRILLGFVFAVGSLAATAQTTRTSSFVTTLGRDTIAVEQYALSGHTLKGTSVVRSPKTTVRDYTAEFGPDGELSRFHVSLHPLNGAVTGERDYLYRGDSIEVTFRQDTMTRSSVVGAKGHPFPLFVDLFAGWDMALQHAVQKGGSREFGVLAGRQVLTYQVKEAATGRLEIVNAEKDFSPLHAIVDRDGELQKLDLTETTDKFVAERVRELNVEALATSFVAHESEGKALGVLSPRDTVKAEIAGAHLLIDYGRPAVRGRKIFGGAVVPWGEVWRTGANAATQLVTDKELLFGNTSVAPGTYSIFSLPSEHGWQLIINRQHGQWGTVYDASKDLARLPMTVERLPNLTERFTFVIAESGKGGVIRFRWAETEASIPFMVKQ